MKLFFNKYFGNVSNSNYKFFTPLKQHPIYVIKVKIEEWFGKQHLVPEKVNEAYYSELGSMISFREGSSLNQSGYCFINFLVR